MVSVHKLIRIKSLYTLRLAGLNWFFVIQRLKEAGVPIKVILPLCKPGVKTAYQDCSKCQLHTSTQMRLQGLLCQSTIARGWEMLKIKLSH